MFISFIICKFLRMTWYIVDRKTDEFRMSGIHVDLAVTRCYCLSLCLWLCLGRPLFYLGLLCAGVRSSVCLCVCCVLAYAWFVGSSVALSVAMLGSSAPLSMLAIYLGPFFCLCLRLLCIYACAWFVSSSICVCCICSCAWIIDSSICVCFLYLCLDCLFISFNFFIVSLNQSIN